MPPGNGGHLRPQYVKLIAFRMHIASKVYIKNDIVSNCCYEVVQNLIKFIVKMHSCTCKDIFVFTK